MNKEAAHKTPLIFYRSSGGKEPVREWLKASAGGRPRLDAGAVALARGHAVVPQLGAGAVGDTHGVAQQAHRPVLLSLDEGVLVALHAFIKKTQKTPDDELALARRRPKELKS